MIQPIPIDANERLCIEQFSATGELILREYGLNEAERQKLHDDRECDAFCGICYQEACDWLARIEKGN